MASYKNLIPDWGDESSNMGGIAQIGYFMPIGEIQTWSLPVANATGENKFIHTQAFVPKTGGGFSKFYTTPEVGELDLAALGGRDGGGFDGSVKIFVPGNTKQLNYLANVCRSDAFVALIPDNDGTLNQLGDPGHYVAIKLDYKTGPITTEHGRGYNGELMVKQPFKLLYTGAIPLKPEEE